MRAHALLISLASLVAGVAHAAGGWKIGTKPVAEITDEDNMAPVVDALAKKAGFEAESAGGASYCKYVNGTFTDKLAGVAYRVEFTHPRQGAAPAGCDASPPKLAEVKAGPNDILVYDAAGDTLLSTKPWMAPGNKANGKRLFDAVFKK